MNSNCAYAISLCADFEGREYFNIAEEKHYAEREWCLLIADILGVPANFQLDARASIPFGMNTRQHWTVDSSKIRSTLAYTEKYDPAQGIRNVVRNLRANHDSKLS